jgi:glycine/D-amino acid oxidase-like deaminating enzyme
LARDVATTMNNGEAIAADRVVVTTGAWTLAKGRAAHITLRETIGIGAQHGAAGATGGTGR